MKGARDHKGDIYSNIPPENEMPSSLDSLDLRRRVLCNRSAFLKAGLKITVIKNWNGVMLVWFQITK